jgi:hypothetical protein
MTPGRGKDFSLGHSTQTCSSTNPTLYSQVLRAEGEAAGTRGCNYTHSPQLSPKSNLGLCLHDMLCRLLLLTLNVHNLTDMNDVQCHLYDTIQQSPTNHWDYINEKHCLLQIKSCKDHCFEGKQWVRKTAANGNTSNFTRITCSFTKPKKADYDNVCAHHLCKPPLFPCVRKFKSKDV